jgi:DNA mismatch endonuclease, patch repair protein
MDHLTKAERSHRMSLIRGKNTTPELVVRSLVHRLGYRYRLHVRTIPGCPDLVFRSRSKVIFVHGCFWHQHANCSIGGMPKSRLEFWGSKFARNKARDIRVKRALTRQGWRYLVLWECETSDSEKLSMRIRDFLDE